MGADGAAGSGLAGKVAVAPEDLFGGDVGVAVEESVVVQDGLEIFWDLE